MKRKQAEKLALQESRDKEVPWPFHLDTLTIKKRGIFYFWRHEFFESNFHMSWFSVLIENGEIEDYTSEKFYQEGLHKYLPEAIQETYINSIRESKTPAQAENIANRHKRYLKCLPNGTTWYHSKKPRMRRALLHKFISNSEIYHKLKISKGLSY